MVSLFRGNWVLHYQWSPIATAALRRRSNLMPITVPNYNRKTDRHPSESARIGPCWCPPLTMNGPFT